MPSMELVLLHALPLDGSMWAAQRDLLPGATHSPTLYGLGDTLAEWAARLLDKAQGDRLIVVGHSVGGSCALEMAVAAPGRIAALVLIGTKAAHRPDPELHAKVLQTLHEKGIAAAWDTFWEPLFARSTDRRILAEAKRLATSRTADEIARGVTAFHTRTGQGACLPFLRQPTLFVTGEQDPAPGMRTMAAQARQCPNGRLLTVPNCGHYMPLEQPETLNAILRTLIKDLARDDSKG